MCTPPPPNFPKFVHHLLMYHSVRVHPSPIWCPSTANEGAQTLYMDTIWMWDAFSVVLQPKPWHPNVIWAPPPPNFSIFTPTCTGISVRVHPYAHPQHIKVLKHFVYIQYGCGTWSEMLDKTGQTDRVIQWTDDLELPEIQQDWVKVDVSRQQGSSRDMRAKLSLLTLYLAIQCHMLSIVKSTSSQHNELKVGKQENVAK